MATSNARNVVIDRKVNRILAKVGIRVMGWTMIPKANLPILMDLSDELEELRQEFLKAIEQEDE